MYVLGVKRNRKFYISKWKGRANNKLPYAFKYRNTKTNDATKLTMEGGTRRFSYGGGGRRPMGATPIYTAPPPWPVYEPVKPPYRVPYIPPIIGYPNKTKAPSAIKYPPPKGGVWTGFIPGPVRRPPMSIGGPGAPVSEPSGMSFTSTISNAYYATRNAIQNYMNNNPNVGGYLTMAGVAAINAAMGRPNTNVNINQVLRVFRALTGGSNYIHTTLPS